MSATVIVSLLIIGVLAGMLSGLIGVGGGVIMIPLLVVVLGYSQHAAQGTSLAVLAVPVTFLAAYNYYSEGYINWKFALIIAIGFVVGGYFGSKLAISINQDMLKKIFGVILLIAAFKMFFGK
ncbi:MAG: sulfite exporter TauE/SafE family protein [Flavobacteriaceae bacterium]|nr:sulfite exporter TauE/SafE family protein [Flavobacteriaceae bacterium]